MSEGDANVPQLKGPKPQPENHGLESVKGAIGSVFIILKFAMVVLVAAFCFSGIQYLEQYETGILVRFGKVDEDIKQKPGLIFALPYPIDKLIKIPAKRTRSLESITFWHQLTDAEIAAGTAEKIPKALKPGIDGYLLTADRNIIHAKCRLKYRIKDPIRYRFSSHNMEKLIEVFLNNAMLKAASVMTIDQALKNKNHFAHSVGTLLSEELHKMAVGVDIDPLDIQLSWPRQLADSIDAVVKTRQKYEQDLSSAKVYARSQQTTAESQENKVKSSATTWAAQKTSRTEADAETFKKLLPLYKKNPAVIKKTLYQDRMKKIMANVDEIFIIEQSEKREIRINLERKETGKQKQNADNS